jgi:hypothetical protein
MSKALRIALVAEGPTDFEVREYRTHAPSITAQWKQIKQTCSQADQCKLPDSDR